MVAAAARNRSGVCAAYPRTRPGRPGRCRCRCRCQESGCPTRRPRTASRPARRRRSGRAPHCFGDSPSSCVANSSRSSRAICIVAPIVSDQRRWRSTTTSSGSTGCSESSSPRITLTAARAAAARSRAPPTERAARSRRRPAWSHCFLGRCQPLALAAVRRTLFRPGDRTEGLCRRGVRPPPSTSAPDCASWSTDETTTRHPAIAR